MDDKIYLVETAGGRVVGYETTKEKAKTVARGLNTMLDEAGKWDDVQHFGISEIKPASVHLDNCKKMGFVFS